VIYAVLVLLLIATALGIVHTRNLFAVVALGGIYSFLMALALLALDAVDVSMTEASVGAGISTVLLLGTLYLTKLTEAPPVKLRLAPLVMAAVTGAALFYGVIHLPPFGDPAAPIHQHVVPRYLNDVVRETGVPNAVTAVLASYRGYDTLGETTVIFTAGMGVLLLLRQRRRRSPDSEDEAEPRR
jgi:multicomponent Na+:H+ antiporter subunit B